MEFPHSMEFPEKLFGSVKYSDEALFRRTPSPGSSTSADSDSASPPQFAHKLAEALDSLRSGATPSATPSTTTAGISQEKKKSVRTMNSKFRTAAYSQQEQETVHRRTSSRLQNMTAPKTQLRQKVQGICDDETESLSDDNAAMGDEEQSCASQDEDQDQDDTEMDIEALLPTPEHLQKYALEGRLQGNVSFISNYLASKYI